MAANTHVSGTGVAGSFYRGNFITGRIKPEVANEIAMIEPGSSPILTMFNTLNRSVKVNNPEYDVLEEWPIGHILIETGAEAADADDIEFDDMTFLIPNSVIMNLRTGEHVYVSGVDASGANSITRSFGTTAAAAGLAGDRWMILSTALEEGQDPTRSLTREVNSHTNYAQGFEAKAAITDLASGQAVFGGPERVRLNNQIILQEKKYENRQFLLGEPGAATGDGSPITSNMRLYTTGGIRYWASLYNNINLGGGFTWKTLGRAMQNIIRFGGGNGQKFAVTSQKVWMELSSLPEIRQLARTTPDASSLGFEITNIKFPGGRLGITVDYNLEEEFLNDELIVYDMKFLDLAVFEPFTASQNIQTLGSHREEWSIHRRVGIRQRLPISSGRLYGLDYAA
jgi:hypothetical protein